MDICYYDSRIKEQIDGAKDYIKRAIHCKEKHPEWASVYASMAEMELGHAENLVKIFNDDYKQETEKIEGDLPDVYPAVYNSVNDMYAECTAKIKYMFDIYKNK